MNALHDTYMRSLRARCVEVLTSEEAEISIRSLETSLKSFGKKLFSLSCPEINISKQVAIIRSPHLTLDLVNPKIVGGDGYALSFRECCVSFGGHEFNCVRYKKILLENGFENRSVVEYSGIQAFLIQHEVDHLQGKLLQDRKVRLALIRESGEIRNTDFCPCASKKRFFECCLPKEDNKP